MVILPKSVDMTPQGHIVPRAQIGEKGYAENVEYNLSIEHHEDGFKLIYYGEDDTYLDVDDVIRILDIWNNEL